MRVEAETIGHRETHRKEALEDGLPEQEAQRLLLKTKIPGRLLWSLVPRALMGAILLEAWQSSCPFLEFPYFPEYHKTSVSEAT